MTVKLHAAVAAAGCAAIIGGASGVVPAPANAGQKTVSIPVTLAVAKDCKISSGQNALWTINVSLPRGEYETPYFFTIGNESVLCSKGTSVNAGPYSGSVSMAETPRDNDGDETATMYYWIVSPGTKLTSGFGARGSACPPAAPVLSPVTSTASATAIVYPLAACVRFRDSIDGGTFKATLPAGKLVY